MPPSASGTIAVRAGSDLRLGGTVWFDWAADGLKGQEYPMIYVAAWQDVNEDGVVDTTPGYLPSGVFNPDMVYGQLDDPDGLVQLDQSGNLVHIGWKLGSGSSLWVQRGGPATCKAWLMVYGGRHGGSIANDSLASVEFEAAG